MSYSDKTFLLNQIDGAYGFYLPRAKDPSGGFFHQFAEDGTMTDPLRRSLIMSSRYVFTTSLAHELFGRPGDLDAMRHAVAFLRDHHRNPETGGYANILSFKDGKAEVVDSDNVTYGLIFVILAYAMAVRAGMTEAGAYLEEIVATLESRVFEAEHGLYADQNNVDWTKTLPYRGQNANMHACEAMIYAYEATRDGWYLDRAQGIAQRIAFDLPKAVPGGEVWEHYASDWSHDMTYNEDDHSEPQRPFGYLSGHQTEWTKLLLLLNRFDPKTAYVERAAELFDKAMEWAWDGEKGGLFYSKRPDGSIYDADKHQWTQAESLAAAGLLSVETGEARFGEWHDRIWAYAEANFFDTKNGGWLRMLSPANEKVGAGRGEPEPDYHNIGACYELLRARKLAGRPNE
ncbi:MAG: AGE family epimerase/isomerase [Pseudomonadota bacterium]|nr:AGE family epimerase/isomerase [Pseudomonadota bacterium]